MELDPGYLRKRSSDGPVSDSVLASVIAAANAYGMLPELLAELDLGGSPNKDLRNLHELAYIYVWLLGSEFPD